MTNASSSPKPTPLKATLASPTPLIWSKDRLREHTRNEVQSNPAIPILVALDDDPSGTQTCHDVPVLTTWSFEGLTKEFKNTKAGSGFFILTNSRVLHPPATKALMVEICQNLKEAAAAAERAFEVVLRGDSTLRGHFPLEPEAVEEALGSADLHLEVSTGGLIIAGSYVLKTTAQLAVLREKSGSRLTTVELDVSKLLESPERAEKEHQHALSVAELELQIPQDVLVMTSRKLITGVDEAKSLDIGSTVAATLVSFLKRLRTKPRYVIAKGGITSSDVATKGSNMKRAMIVGQAAAGVPLWRCDEPTCKHPIVAGVSGQSTNESIQLAKDTAEAGASFALLLPPSFWATAVSGDVLHQVYRDVADESPLPVVCYNFPCVTSGVDLNSDDLTIPASQPNIVATKITCGNVGEAVCLTSNSLPRNFLFVAAPRTSSFRHLRPAALVA